MNKNILDQNKNSWNAIADDWFGTTALPTYGCHIPDENSLNLFGEVKGKKVLDIGCGSGHSLKFMGDKGAAELWGLDMSSKQIENAGNFLKECGYHPGLYTSPMELDPGLPGNYFDIVYSIYAIGWTMDLQGTFQLIASYLKKDGIFIFSWDHPFMHCVDVVENQLLFSCCYFEEELFTFQKGGHPVSLYNRKMSDYINALARAGFCVEQLVEETDKELFTKEHEFSSAYYAPCKAVRFPLSFVLKARKL